MADDSVQSLLATAQNSDAILKYIAKHTKGALFTNPRFDPPKLRIELLPDGVDSYLLEDIQGCVDGYLKSQGIAPTGFSATSVQKTAQQYHAIQFTFNSQTDLDLSDGQMAFLKDFAQDLNDRCLSQHCMRGM